MKKYLPLLVLLVFASWVGGKLRPAKNYYAVDVPAFGKLPVLADGRFKPLDTVARTALLQFQGRQRVQTPEAANIAEIDRFLDVFRAPEKYYSYNLTPTRWLLDVIFWPELADTYQTFEVVNPDLLAIFDLKREDGLENKRFSWNQLSPRIAELDRQRKIAAPIESAVRTSFQRAVIQLYNNLVEYHRLQLSFVSPGRPDFLGNLLKFQDIVVAGRAAVMAKQKNEPYDEAAFNAIMDVGEQFGPMQQWSNLRIVPPETNDGDNYNWHTGGDVLTDALRSERVNPTMLAYAAMGRTWRQQQPAEFNKLIGLHRATLEKRFAPQLEKAAAEASYNAAEPFYSGMVVYGLAFFVGIASWLAWPDLLRRSATWLVVLGWVAATGGILTRMWLEGRPPVTNLYSSALFVGWGAVALCLVLESLFKNAIGAVTAGMVGFITLFIAHHLSMSGDTLEMMRAVLDSNFWLATHVVIVSTGYASTFLAGFLALVYVFRGVFTKTLDKATADALARMVYGIVCFATLFSFVGTVLGGIWADQSWGRFWGWDPKENGALLIVIWNALVLHARWGGMIKQRGLMCLAIGGNIVTSWSWFGTNMLGVGLHSYGFTDAAFVALSTFVTSQLVIIGLANLPLEKWRSFQRAPGPRTSARPVPAAAVR